MKGGVEEEYSQIYTFLCLVVGVPVQCCAFPLFQGSLNNPLTAPHSLSPSITVLLSVWFLYLQSSKNANKQKKNEFPQSLTESPEICLTSVPGEWKKVSSQCLYYQLAGALTKLTPLQLLRVSPIFPEQQ